MTHFIDGKWKQGSGEHFNSVNPANENIIWTGRAANDREVDQAVYAARTAFETWSLTDFDTRESYIRKFVTLLEQNKKTLSEILAQDTGKIIWEAEAEINIMINKFAISIEAYKERCPERIKEFSAFKSVTRHRPYGVAAVFGPYNFPGHIPNGHIMPALLAGNTIILKPSELTPLISEEIIKLWQETGIANGVINLLQGQSETGVLLANHNEINALFFTGSSRTGKILHENFAGKIDKILALELGGNNPLLVIKASNTDAAAYMILQSAFLTNGQRCTCARRLILVKDTNSEKILSRLIEISKSMKIGDPMNGENFMGPLITDIQAAKMLAYQESLLEKGAEPLLKMKRLSSLGNAYVSPGIIDCSQAEGIEDEEFFGPLLQVFKVANLNEAIELANKTKYGLAAGIITDDEKIYNEFLMKAKAGLINWNNQLTGATSTAPFGGLGLSGNHRPSAYYAADYCAYPVASLETQKLELPAKLSPGITL
jgi:succinylglutamic semialdehyde dehydrogenase